MLPELLLVASMAVAQTSEESLVGEYRRGDGFVSVVVQLLDDGTFIHRTRSCTSATEIEGIWEDLGGGLIRPFSEESLERGESSVRGVEANAEGVSVQVTDPYGEALPGVLVWIVCGERLHEQITGTDGRAKVVESCQVSELTAWTDGFVPAEYRPGGEDWTSFEIELALEGPEGALRQGELWFVRDGELWILDDPLSRTSLDGLEADSR